MELLDLVSLVVGDVADLVEKMQSGSKALMGGSMKARALFTGGFTADESALVERIKDIT